MKLKTQGMTWDISSASSVSGFKKIINIGEKEAFILGHASKKFVATPSLDDI